MPTRYNPVNAFVESPAPAYLIPDATFCSPRALGTGDVRLAQLAAALLVAREAADALDEGEDARGGPGAYN